LYHHRASTVATKNDFIIQSGLPDDGGREKTNIFVFFKTFASLMKMETTKS